MFDREAIVAPSAEASIAEVNFTISDLKLLTSANPRLLSFCSI
jgi:hypothetical protein